VSDDQQEAARGNGLGRSLKDTLTGNSSTGDCRYWVGTRLKAPAGKVRARSCWWKSMRPSTQ
jgi:hypothetical protein